MNTNKKDQKRREGKEGMEQEKEKKMSFFQNREKNILKWDKNLHRVSRPGVGRRLDPEPK